MNDDQDEQIPTYSIAVDLQLAGLDNLVAQAGAQKTWYQLFLTNNFLEGLGELHLEDFRLKDRHLRRIGAEITEMRKDIKNHAYEIAQQEASSLEEKEQIVIKHAKKLKNRGTQRDLGILKLEHEEYKEQTLVG